MKVSISPYRLSATRSGALLRFEFPEGRGYADCHPWTELGDAPLEEQLSRLASGQFTVLTERSLHFAGLDARARARGQNLLSGKKVPRSHYLVTGLVRLSEDARNASDLGFERMKLKVGRNPSEELAALQGVFADLAPSMRLRLDFNSLLAEEDLCRYLERLGPWLGRIDFIEDPVRRDPRVWKRIRRDFGVRIAADREWGPEIEAEADFVVVKPAVQLRPVTRLPVIFTSYLDHPLGQVCAAFEAASASAEEVCGLLSHRVYERTPFSEALGEFSPEFQAPTGTGFGFDELLESRDWVRLSG